MPRRVLKTKAIEKQLRKAGFIKHEGAKHEKWIHPDGRRTAIRRGQKEYYGGPLDELETQSGLTFK